MQINILQDHFKCTIVTNTLKMGQVESKNEEKSLRMIIMGPPGTMQQETAYSFRRWKRNSITKNQRKVLRLSLGYR
jgi:hypothetical protein